MAIKTTDHKISDMHFASCAATIEKALKQHTGVRQNAFIKGELDGVISAIHLTNQTY